jgi:hypothetical protein
MYTGQHGRFALAIQVGEQFTGAAEAGETSVLYTGAAWEWASLQHEHTMVRMNAFISEGCEEPDKSSTDHGQVRIGMETGVLPDAEHGRRLTWFWPWRPEVQSCCILRR